MFDVFLFHSFFVFYYSFILFSALVNVFCNHPQNPDSWVVVHHLQTQSGILDPDDAVQDVADDREQIIASYDDHPGPDPTVSQGGGDGASGSSVGTGSPDIFRVHEGKYSPASNQNENGGQNHIDVTELDQPPNSLTLQVRRGSEPSLLTLDQNSQLYPLQNSQEPSKRWSAALVCRDDPPERILTGGTSNGIYHQPNWTVPEQEEYQNESLPTFTRSGRLSMQFLGDGAKYVDLLKSNLCAFFYLLLHSRVKVSQTHTHIFLSLFLELRSRSLVALLAVLLWPALPAHYFCTKTHSSYRWIEAAEKAAISHNTSDHSATTPNSSFHSKSLPRDAKRKEPLGQANASTYESIRQKIG